MNIIYIANHLNASLITECKEHISNYIANRICQVRVLASQCRSWIYVMIP